MQSSNAAGVLEVQELRSPEALAAIAGEWKVLWERTPGLHCFQRPEWLLAWVRQFFRGEQIWALAIRREGRLAGLAPLFIHRHQRNFEVRQVSFIGAGISDYLDILLEPEIADWGASLILEHLAEHRDRWDICDMQELPPGSAVMRSAFPAILHATCMGCGVCPVLELPATVGEFQQWLQGRFKNLRRTIRQLERTPEVEFASADHTSYEEFLRELFDLHRARWQERRETGMLVTPEQRAFHAEVAAGFENAGLLRCYRMRYAGETVSVWYGFASRGRYYAYLTGFDPEFSRYSPGQVLLAYSMRAAINEGAEKYDFLRKTEDFKHRWGAEDCANARLLIWHTDSRLPSPRFVEEAHAGLQAL